MHDDGAAGRDALHDGHRGVEDGLDVLQPARVAELGHEALGGRRRHRRRQRPQRGPHLVDVLDALEGEDDVVVELLALVALAARLVGHGVHVRPRVDDVDDARVGRGAPDPLDVLLVLRAAAAAHAHQGLRAPHDGRAVLVEVGEHRQPRLAPEAGAALDHRLRRLRGDEEALRVRRAEAVPLVQVAEAPVVVRHSLRAKGQT